MKSFNTRECRRCGKCCIKGGPCFHIQDLDLIEKGIIPIKDLYTIRKGELVKDDIRGGIVKPLISEIIKIKEKSDSWACIFFDEKSSSCNIYQNRPVECRVLKCWDTREIKAIYSKQRLTRKDLLKDVSGLWDLVQDHESKCSYEVILQLVKQNKTGQNKKEIDSQIEDMLKYDKVLRDIVVEKGYIKKEQTNFMFGRPLSETIKTFY